MHSTPRRRAVLIAPASDDRKARKALVSAADEVVLDLEDAVIPATKGAARTAALSLVREFGPTRPVSIRINGLGTEWIRDDLAVCNAAGSALASVVLPKTESAEHVREVDRLLGTSPARIQALVETPLGIRSVSDVCAASTRLETVIIGYADLGAALGRARTAGPGHWIATQEKVLIAARSAGVSVIDGPHLSIADDDGFRTAKQWVRDLGFDGTWVIHPGQLATATEIFTPTLEAVAEAQRVLGALREAEERGAGAAQLDGQMLDEAIAVAARRTLAQGAPA